jgi:hypothetical protein
VFAYRDKKVVGVFVRFSCTASTAGWLVISAIGSTPDPAAARAAREITMGEVRLLTSLNLNGMVRDQQGP